MLKALCEIQRLAYQPAEHRCARDVLHMYLMCLQFSLTFSDVFQRPKKLTVRRLFGAPYHSIVKHFPEQYRSISLRSLVAESAERLFSDFRAMSTCTNKHGSNVIKNIFTRMRFQDQHDTNGPVKRFQQSEKSVSSVQNAARCLAKTARSVITTTAQKNKAAMLSFYKSISDFLIEGQGVWYHAESDGTLIFYDAHDDPASHTRPTLTSFRWTTIETQREYLERCWRDCGLKSGELKLSLFQKLVPCTTLKQPEDIDEVEVPSLPVENEVTHNSEQSVVPDVADMIDDSVSAISTMTVSSMNTCTTVQSASNTESQSSVQVTRKPQTLSKKEMALKEIWPGSSKRINEYMDYHKKWRYKRGNQYYAYRLKCAAVQVHPLLHVLYKKLRKESENSAESQKDELKYKINVIKHYLNI